jgi:hypothetical protein
MRPFADRLWTMTCGDLRPRPRPTLHRLLFILATASNLAKLPGHHHAFDGPGSPTSIRRAGQDDPRLRMATWIRVFGAVDPPVADSFTFPLVDFL